MKEIKFLEPASLAKITAGISFVLALVFVLPTELILLIKVLMFGAPINSLGVLPLGTLAFTGLAYVCGLISAYSYNFLASKIGGLEIDIADN